MAKKIKGNLNRPRLYIFKSNKHIYAQIIDDINKKILCSSSSISNELKYNIQSHLNCQVAYIVGKNIGKRAKNIGIKNVLFDRGSRLYHGHIKSLADGVRNEGIKF